MKLQNILVPASVNQLEHAQKAIKIARSMCTKDGTITLLNAQEPVPGFVSHYLPEDTIKSRNAELFAELNELVDGDDRIRVKLVSGRAGVAIVDYATENETDLIIIASHRPGLQDYFLGSTAARVVRHSPCAVYVLR